MFYKRFEDSFLECCGRGGGSAQGSSRGGKVTALPQPQLAGATVRVRYTGRRAGNAPFYGVATRTQYRFGLGQVEGSVYPADLDALLLLRGTDSFEVVQ